MLDNMVWYYKAQLKNLRTKKVAIENPINEFFNANVMTLRVGIQLGNSPHAGQTFAVGSLIIQAVIQFCETASCRAGLYGGASCHNSRKS
jgi:hypothetical protein